MRKLRVGWDLDGVEYDFAESCRRFARDTPEYAHLNLCKGEPSSWYFYRAWGMTDAEFVKFCHRGADEGYIFTGPTRMTGRYPMQQVKDMGHEVHIITDRSFGSSPSVSEEHTKNWLSQHGYPYDTLTFSADKTIVPTDIFIEDKIQNYDALDAAGTEVWLINRPWNLEDDDRRRLRSVGEFVSKVRQMASKELAV